MLRAVARMLSAHERGRRRHLRICRAVVDTPPLVLRDAPLRFLSMCCHADVLPYLVAAKSVYRRIGEGRFIVVDDGTLTGGDRALLARHLGAEFAAIDAVPTGRCPRGGTWERLLGIVDRLGGHYVVQIDADTLATGPLDEVARCYRENRCFTLGTVLGPDFVSLADAAAAARKRREASRRHIQLEAEAHLDRLPDAAGRRYVRGSSGFAGFARGSMDRAQAEWFSVEMERLIGPIWRDWGSEQVTSNFLVANAPGSVVLPQPDYACFNGDNDGSASVFLHFYGTHRFDLGVYSRVSAAEIRAMG